MNVLKGNSKKQTWGLVISAVLLLSIFANMKIHWINHTSGIIKVYADFSSKNSGVHI